MAARRKSPKLPRPLERYQAAVNRYWDAAQQPFYVLLFVFPMIAVYEFGAFMQRGNGLPAGSLVAETAIHGLLSLLGAHGGWVPAIALIGTLLVWHVLSRNPWHVEGWALGLMLAESILLAFPLLIITYLPLEALAGGTPLQALSAGIRPYEAVMALGAALYEELLFRLYLVTGLLWLLIDVVRVPRTAGSIAAVGLAAVLFAACHVEPIGIEVMAWDKFIARTVAGFYLSLIFLERGLGIAIGCHAAHNLMLLLFNAGSGRM